MPVLLIFFIDWHSLLNVVFNVEKSTKPDLNILGRLGFCFILVSVPGYQASFKLFSQ